MRNGILLSTIVLSISYICNPTASCCHHYSRVQSFPSISSFIAAPMPSPGLQASRRQTHALPVRLTQPCKRVAFNPPLTKPSFLVTKPVRARTLVVDVPFGTIFLGQTLCLLRQRSREDCLITLIIAVYRRVFQVLSPRFSDDLGLYVLLSRSLMYYTLLARDA